MSLYGVLRSGVSGMNAQSNKLGTVAENIQNSSTTGYKRASTEFSSLILPSSEGNYNSGSVTSRVRYTIADQGPIAYTTSGTDLAISGNGFFVVSDPGGSPYLTRAGNFVVDGKSGNLVNAAGFTLMGYSLAAGPAAPSLNSLDGVVPVNMSSFGMQATGSTKGTFNGNLPFSQPPVVPPAVSKQSSLQVFDKVGNPIKINIDLAKIDADTWTITVSNGTNPLAPLTGTTTMNLDFDADGKITGPTVLSFGIPGGETFDLDMKGMTQLAGDYSVTGTANGNAPSAVKDAEFASDGTVYAVYEDGSRVAAYRIPLATVPSPDNLSPRAGNVYETTASSGGYQVGFPETSGFGSIASGALEGSNVDIGTELTAMIEAQTSYTANSKVFQTGSELLDVLMNLKR
ncbi:flagellar hook protein FlgE [Microvirga arsenatis]|uniref:Flagellar hook protein FlgE n=1 Tax=Microvirga arsenatis TaxID=2692265 RepID=A0ABW9YYP7_9HYPH|nr:flagellar hook protein FlgE [Microvirga arsenatis]NBJ11022.1 flagellar hook-basal body complex protein [Microvirga arsenatis]NBJ25295.1 flagellar hook-basal body complex protein [Microvirga arsenatis]